MDARSCGVWCAVGDEVSHLGPSICELIFEVGNNRQTTISLTMPESVLASDSSSESVASASTLSLLATSAELNAIGTIDDVLNWADVEALVWNAVMVNLGRVGKLRFFAALPSDVLVVAITAARVEPEGRKLTPMEATQVGLARRVARQRFGLPDVALEDSQPPTSSQQPTSSTPTITPNEKAVRTGGDGQLSEDEPDGHRDRREDGTKRTRVEEKADGGTSSVTATANKIDDDRLSQEPWKLEEAKAIRKVKFAAVIDQCDEGEVPALGQAF